MLRKRDLIKLLEPFDDDIVVVFRTLDHDYGFMSDFPMVEKVDISRTLNYQATPVDAVVFCSDEPGE